LAPAAQEIENGLTFSTNRNHPMKLHNIDAAVAEAHRFIERAETLMAAVQKSAPRAYLSDHPRESGAVKRASMDLTRALAEMRRRGS
jgi:hypothetical protein